MGLDFKGLVLRVKGLGFGVRSLRFRVLGVRDRSVLELWVQVLGFKI